MGLADGIADDIRYVSHTGVTLFPQVLLNSLIGWSETGIFAVCCHLTPKMSFLKDFYEKAEIIHAVILQEAGNGMILKGVIGAGMHLVQTAVQGKSQSRN